MTDAEMIDMLQADLKNERKHLNFYVHAAAMVVGPHREEFSEFFMKEAQGELKHIEEFCQMIVYLGGVPGFEAEPIGQYPTGSIKLAGSVLGLLGYARDMENEVADIYATRLKNTEAMATAAEAVLHLFYEDQIQDSWKTAKEIELMLK